MALSSREFLKGRLEEHCSYIPENQRWYSKHKERAELEIGLLTEMSSMEPDLVNGNFVFTETMENGYGHEFLIVMIPHYKNFPFVEPKVFCVDPIPKFDFKYHVFGDGSLCLGHSFPSKTSLLNYRNLSLLWCSSYESYLEYGEHLA